MTRLERAKQFMPFDALKGLQDALRVKESEHEMIFKREVSEEDAKQISDTLLKLKNRDYVELVYYDNGKYKTLSGKVLLNLSEHKLKFENESVNLSDIFSIEIKRKGEKDEVF